MGEEKEGWLPFDVSEAGQKARNFLTKKRLLVLLALVALIPAVYSGVIISQRFLATFSTVQQYQLTVQTNYQNGTNFGTLLIGQNQTFTLTITNPNNFQVQGKIVIEVDFKSGTPSTSWLSTSVDGWVIPDSSETVSGTKVKAISPTLTWNAGQARQFIIVWTAYQPVTNGELQVYVESP